MKHAASFEREKDRAKTGFHKFLESRCGLMTFYDAPATRDTRVAVCGDTMCRVRVLSVSRHATRTFAFFQK
jgi:hypothetical protein